MPKWSDAPPKAVDVHAFRILRTPQDSPLCGIITCTDVVGCPTHFVGNRTLPCEGQNECNPCKAGHSWRWHGYVTAIMVPTHEHFLFEFTATGSDTFKNYLRHHGSMRGCKFVAKRPSKKANGRVVISCIRIDEQGINLPEPPDVKKILCHIWGISHKRVTKNPGHRRPLKDLSVAPANSNGE